MVLTSDKESAENQADLRCSIGGWMVDGRRSQIAGQWLTRRSTQHTTLAQEVCSLSGDSEVVLLYSVCYN
eukprot:scaffold303588_cov51-Attheya_sp.AAC.3